MTVAAIAIGALVAGLAIGFLGTAVVLAWGRPPHERGLRDQIQLQASEQIGRAHV